MSGTVTMIRSPTITDAEARRRLSLAYDVLIEAAARRRRRLAEQQADDRPDAKEGVRSGA